MFLVSSSWFRERFAEREGKGGDGGEGGTSEEKEVGDGGDGVRDKVGEEEEGDKVREEDGVKVEKEEDANKSESPNPFECPSKVHHITITHFTPKTYKALLIYLYSSQISFSSIHPEADDVPQPQVNEFHPARRLVEAEHSGFFFCEPFSSPSSPSTNPSPPPKSKPLGWGTPPPPTPFPISPSLIYPLAVLLRFPTLAALALVVYKSQLTVDNVVGELFERKLVREFKEVAEVCLDFVGRGGELGEFFFLLLLPLFP